MLEKQTDSKEQSSIEQLHRLDIDLARLVNNHRIRSVFVAKQQDLFQVLTFMSYISLGVPDFIKALILYFQA